MIPVKLTGFKVGGNRHGRKRTRRHLRQQYGNPQPLPKATAKDFIIVIGSFAVFGIIVLSTLYWIFG